MARLFRLVWFCGLSHAPENTAGVAQASINKKASMFRSMREGKKAQKNVDARLLLK